MMEQVRPWNPCWARGFLNLFPSVALMTLTRSRCRHRFDQMPDASIGLGDCLAHLVCYLLLNSSRCLADGIFDHAFASRTVDLNDVAIQSKQWSAAMFFRIELTLDVPEGAAGQGRSEHTQRISSERLLEQARKALAQALDRLEHNVAHKTVGYHNIDTVGEQIVPLHVTDEIQIDLLAQPQRFACQVISFHFLRSIAQ